ncbi:MAG: TerC family protein [Alphaproteobacteria bacterium]|nr:MAG: TerC family protein [Alphaproteobacteria bacterium]
MEILTADGFVVLIEVVLIDLVLAGDNAVVIGMAAAGLPAEQRGKAILVGIGAATVLRIGFALLATQLLEVLGLLLVGGILLLWVSWRMWRELCVQAAEHRAAHEALAEADLEFLAEGSGTAVVSEAMPRKSFGQAALQIVVADISMSLDNVLAVGGAAHEHPTVLIFGLVLSVALMGLAASYIARLLDRHSWLAYLGLGVILMVALEMIWEGSEQLWPVVAAHL